jgi:hypothetical protein
LDLLVLAYGYFYVIAIPLLDIGSILYSVRLSRVTGSFRAWSVMIGFIVLFPLQAISSGVGLEAIFQPAKFAASITSQGAGVFVASSMYNLALSAILFAAMLEIFMAFSNVKSKVSVATPSFD